MNTIDLTGERQKRIYQMYDGHHCPSWLLIGVTRLYPAVARVVGGGGRKRYQFSSLLHWRGFHAP